MWQIHPKRVRILCEELVFSSLALMLRSKLLGSSDAAHVMTVQGLIWQEAASHASQLLTRGFRGLGLGFFAFKILC